MDDFKENQQPSEIKKTEESTVFSAPAEHDNKKPKSLKKRRVISIISVVLVVCLLLGGTLAVIKLIPKLEDEDNGSSTDNTITVIDFNSSKFDAVTVQNENGEFMFYPVRVQGDGSSDLETTSSEFETNWYLKDVPIEKISASRTSEIVSAAAKITATMEITKKTFDECGLNSPFAKVSVSSKELGDFELTFGSVSPDNSGIYLYSSIDEKIYLVLVDLAENFDFNKLDLASTDAVPAVVKQTGTEDYFDENGSLISFDELRISGKKYLNPVVIVPVNEKEGESVSFAYKTISPLSKYAEGEEVTSFFSAFSTGISVSGVYSLETDTKVLKEFGLNDPDVIITLTLAGKNYTYKFALQQDGFYALCGDGITTIKKVSDSSASFLKIEETEIYNKLLYSRPISDIKSISFVSDDLNYGFSVKENAEDADEKFTVYCGKKLIKSENFQNFYMHFVSMALVDFSYKQTGNAVMTVKITCNNGAEDTLLFYKSSATDYYCSLSGQPLGRITATTFNKLVNDIQKVADNGNVEE